MADNSNGNGAEWRKWAHQVLTRLVDALEQQRRFNDEQHRLNDEFRRSNDEQKRVNDEFRDYIRKNDRRMAALIRMIGRHESDIKVLKKRRA